MSDKFSYLRAHKRFSFDSLLNVAMFSSGCHGAAGPLSCGAVTYQVPRYLLLQCGAGVLTDVRTRS